MFSTPGHRVRGRHSERLPFHFLFSFILQQVVFQGPGIESRWGEIFRTCPNRPWGPPNLLYNGYRVFPGGKERPEREVDISPPSSAVVVKE